MGERRGVCTILVWRHDGKRPLARHKYSWDDNIKMVLQEVKWAWIGLIWLRVGTGGELV